MPAREKAVSVYLMTDLEGVAGVLDFDNYCTPASRYYECAHRLLTEEANAAVRGFLKGGADEVVVVDGHGPGGLDSERLAPPAKIQRFWPEGPYPLGLDRHYSAVAFVGQHAKACTPFSHMAHTGSFSVVDLSLNGISIGEYGQVVLCAMELGIPTVFASGEEALCREAEALTPGVVTVSVKRGLIAAAGSDLPEQAYAHSKLAAIHMNPADACAAIERGACRAMLKWKKTPGLFHYPKLSKPYRVHQLYRISESIWPGSESYASDEDSISAAFNNLHLGKKKK